MKKFLLAIYVSLALMVFVTPAHAIELWLPHIPAIYAGEASGIVPPPGFYFIDFSAWAPTYHAFNNNGDKLTDVKVGIYLNQPVLYWSSGCKILGGDYAAAISEPIDYTDFKGLNVGPTGFTRVEGDQVGTYNTAFVPIILGWHLPCNLHVTTSFEVQFDDPWNSTKNSLAAIVKGGNPGSSAIPAYAIRFFDPNVNAPYPVPGSSAAYLWSGVNSYQFLPQLGISWLYGGWNLSAHFFYDIYTKNNAIDFQGGDVFQADYNIAYTCGHWTFGVAIGQANQIQSDKFRLFNPATFQYGPYQSQPGTKAVQYQAGPFIGYNFGPCSLQLTQILNIETENYLGGPATMLTIVIPLGNPFAAGGR